MNQDMKRILILLVFTAFLRVAFIPATPLIRDEATYAQMIDEFIAKPTLIPHYLGYEVAWRPVLFIAPYAALIAPIQHSDFLPIEVIYRWPSLFFALLFVIVFYYFTKKLYGSDVALMAGVVYAGCPLAIYVDSSLLADTLLNLTILCSLYCYVKGKDDERYFLVAGAFAFTAFFVKTVVAFIIIPLVLAYFLFGDRKFLKNRFFLLSLLAIPLAIAAYWLMFSNPSTILTEYTGNVSGKVVGGSAAERILGSLWAVGILLFFWLGLYATGVIMNWKKNLFLLVWVAMTIFPLWGGTWMPWYYMPILPALSIFGAMTVLGGGKADNLALAFALFLIMVSFVLLVMFYQIKAEAVGEMVAGRLVGGKGTVLFVGEYQPSSIFYTLNRGTGINEMCWYFSRTSKNMTYPEVDGVVHAYSSSGRNVSERANDLFWESRDLRLPCRVSSFDYVITKQTPPFEIQGYSRIVCVDWTCIYKKSG